MGLIIKKSFKQLLAGYPTVSDKYDVQGGILGGATAGHYGDVLVMGANQGEYNVATDNTGKIAGILLATNIKLVKVFPGGTNAENATFEVGEAINLCFKGFVAVKLSDTVDPAIAEGDQVYIDAAGKLTADSTGTAVTGWTFTGIYEETATGFVAEIKMA